MRNWRAGQVTLPNACEISKRVCIYPDGRGLVQRILAKAALNIGDVNEIPREIDTGWSFSINFIF